MKSVFKKIFVTVGVMAAVFGMIWKCASHIDKARSEKRERETKLEQGTCVFDAVDLTAMSIGHNGMPLKFMEKLDYLKQRYPEAFRHVPSSATYRKGRQIRIANTELTLEERGDFFRITQLGFDLSSEFQLTIPAKTPINCDYTLPQFNTEYPNSYACRETFLHTSKTEHVIVRIDNTRADSELQFILLYFNFMEKLYQAEFIYSGE